MLKKSLLFVSLTCFPLMAADDGTDRNPMAIQPSMKMNSDFLPIHSQNPQYQKLFNLAHGFRDFCHECERELRRDSRYKAISQNNINVSESWAQLIEQLDKGIKSLDEVLQEILYSRLQSIQHRANDHREAREYREKHRKMPQQSPVSTHPGKMRDLKDVARILAEQAIDWYQCVNSIIYHLFKLVEDPKKLSERTKEHLSCSRTLWPLLLDETTDLSYPDFAAITQGGDPIEYQDQKDSDYFRDNYELRDYEIIPRRGPTENKGGRKPIVVRLTWSQIADMLGKPAEQWKALRLPRPFWLYNTAPQAEEANVRGSSVQKEEVRASDSLALPQKKKKFPPKNNVRRPSRQKGTEKAVKALHTAAETEPAPPTVASQTGDTSSPREKEGEIPGEETSWEPVGPEKLDVSAEGGSQPSEPSLQLESSPIREEIKLEKSSRGPSKPAKIKPEKPKASPVLPQSDPYLAPKGMRNRGNEGGCERGDLPLVIFKLSGSHEKVMEAIFDYHARGQGFNFGQFRSLWEHVNGAKSVRSSGGSHHALLDKDGKVIGGTFAHGDSQTYTRKTVRYLRAALMDIGLAPK